MVQHIVNAAQGAVNHGSTKESQPPFDKRLFVKAVDNNTFEMYLQNARYAAGMEREAPSMDCCLAHVFGWGKTSAQQAVRAAYAAKLAEGTLEEPDSILTAPKDWLINTSERFKYYGGLMMLLGHRDANSHRILMVTLRQPLHKTYRHRSAAALEKRSEQKRKWKESRTTEGRSRGRGTSSSSWSWNTSSWSPSWSASSWAGWSAWSQSWWEGADGAEVSDQCVAYVANDLTVQGTTTFESWMFLIPLFIYLLGFISALILVTCRWRKQKAKVLLTRSIATQSQTTYTALRKATTPRFLPLPEVSHGATETLNLK
jgi:hypothetical protein